MPSAPSDSRDPSVVRRRRRAAGIVATFVVCGLVSSTAGGQEKDLADAVRVEQFKRSYQATLPSLIGRYSINRKIRYRHTTYATESGADWKVGDVVSTSVNELITDGRRIKLVVLEATPAELKDTHDFWRPDVQFSVTRNNGRYQIADLIRPSSRNYSHESARYAFFAHEPIRAGGYTLATALWYEDFGPHGPFITIEHVGDTTWRGRRCLEVRSRWDVGNKSLWDVASTFLDPDNQFTLGTETDWFFYHGFTRRYKIINEIEYQPSLEGVLFPKSSRQTLECEDGTSGKVYDVEFLAYDSYEPKPDEFQLEGPYQLTTPYLSPPQAMRAPAGPTVNLYAPPVEAATAPPSSVGKTRRWVVLGAFACLAAALVFLVRHTTRRTAGPS